MKTAPAASAETSGPAGRSLRRRTTALKTWRRYCLRHNRLLTRGAANVRAAMHSNRIKEQGRTIIPELCSPTKEDCKRALRNNSKRRDTILDPFAGSGARITGARRPDAAARDRVGPDVLRRARTAVRGFHGRPGAAERGKSRSCGSSTITPSFAHNARSCGLTASRLPGDSYHFCRRRPNRC
jgi:hypothetical protein